ncbi:hypothetical protein RB12629 [Rhodopirellula baltica SH 1]|uniref:Uncharacterized protein n=1 Tax=Rhodopirellula baltica (strain DSM 10527 / NCIMB 13988 / SH1) TaxID=243090 RepID=Q7UIC3_RHOBA|nr:hypothetical protein RB12629 [Rhodopirellula baltica SH 1]
MTSTDKTQSNIVSLPACVHLKGPNRHREWTSRSDRARPTLGE